MESMESVSEGSTLESESDSYDSDNDDERQDRLQELEMYLSSTLSTSTSPLNATTGTSDFNILSHLITGTKSPDPIFLPFRLLGATFSTICVLEKEDYDPSQDPRILDVDDETELVRSTRHAALQSLVREGWEIRRDALISSPVSNPDHPVRSIPQSNLISRSSLSTLQLPHLAFLSASTPILTPSASITERRPRPRRPRLHPPRQLPRRPLEPPPSYSLSAVYRPPPPPPPLTKQEKEAQNKRKADRIENEKEQKKIKKEERREEEQQNRNDRQEKLRELGVDVDVDVDIGDTSIGGVGGNGKRKKSELAKARRALKRKEERAL